MVHVANSDDLAALFTIPFKRQKIIYSLNDEYFQEGNSVCKIKEKQLAIDIDDEDLLHNSYSEFPCGEQGCRVLFTSVHEYEIHYRSAHSLVCSQCKKTFPSYNLLDIHIEEKHDSYHKTAQENNLAVFRCLSHGCCAVFTSARARNNHLIHFHQYPKDFKFNETKITPRDTSEKMDVTQMENCPKLEKSLRNISKPKVPQNICFGHGSMRGFSRKRPAKTSKDITMKELADVL